SLDCAKRQEYVAIVRHTELRSGFVAGNRVRIEARISRVGDVKDLVPRQGIVTLKNLVGPFGHDMNQISFLRNQLSNLEILLRPPRIMWKCIVDSPHNLASLALKLTQECLESADTRFGIRLVGALTSDSASPMKMANHPTWPRDVWECVEIKHWQRGKSPLPGGPIKETLEPVTTRHRCESKDYCFPSRGGRFSQSRLPQKAQFCELIRGSAHQ